MGRLIGFGRYEVVVAIALLGASEIYFLVLVACSVRTLWGTGFGAAIVATLVGLAAHSSVALPPSGCWAR